MTDRTAAAKYITDDQREALLWVVREAINHSVERRGDLDATSARQEWDDLHELIALLPAESYELTRELGQRP